MRTWYDSNAGYVLKAPAGMEQKPEGLDWERWLGPGPKIAWNPDVYFSPYKWLHYDGGMIMGIGIHVIDSAHQFMKLSKPKAAMAGGGTYHFTDRDTPDVINLIIQYPEGLNVTFEAEIMTCGMPSSSAGIELRGPPRAGRSLERGTAAEELAGVHPHPRETDRERSGRLLLVDGVLHGCGIV